MKKNRKYLKDLIPVNINALVLENDYAEIPIGDTLLNLTIDRHPNGKHYIALFRNHLRQIETWELSAKPRNGRLGVGD